jgi:hypothetical protein
MRDKSQIEKLVDEWIDPTWLAKQGMAYIPNAQSTCMLNVQGLLKIQATLMGMHTTVTVINLKHFDEFHHEFGWQLRFLNILTKEEGSYTHLGVRTFPPYTS